MVSTLPPTVKIDALYYVVIFRINSFVLNLFVLYSVPFHNIEMAHVGSLQPVVPSWVLAVIVGLCGSYKLYHLSPAVTGSLSYAITFAMYALMITSGLFVHSLFLVECGQAPVSQVCCTHTHTYTHSHSHTHPLPHAHTIPHVTTSTS